MSMSERDKMKAGDWYRCQDPELEVLQHKARQALHVHNTSLPDPKNRLTPELAKLFAAHGSDCFIEAPFHCAYGFNITLGPIVYLNAGCTILDTAPVQIGNRCMLGPGVQIYCAQHHKDPVLRAQGLEQARPVTLEDDVWIGGGAILMPGVSIGQGAIVGAGSVVLRDVKAGTTVVGNPARSLSN